MTLLNCLHQHLDHTSEADISEMGARRAIRALESYRSPLMGSGTAISFVREVQKESFDYHFKGQGKSREPSIWVRRGVYICLIYQKMCIIIFSDKWLTYVPAVLLKSNDSTYKVLMSFKKISKIV